MNKPTSEELSLLHQELCSALSDPTRIAILYELAEGPRHVSGIVGAMGLPQGTVSRHLRILRERGIVIATREGNRVLYRLGESRVLDILTLMREILADTMARRHETARRIETMRPRRRK